MRRLFLAYCLTVSVGLAVSQSRSSDSVLPLSKMVLKQWTVDEGLISNNLTSVAQTNDGFIWLTTFNGAVRFDGINFKLFDNENYDFLKTNAFYSVTSDAEGVILSTQGSGVARYKVGQLSPMSEFEASSVRKILIDSQGRYWCGTNNEGLFVKEGDTVKKVEFEAFDQVVILDIFEDSSGRVWFATDGNGVIVFENGDYRTYDLGNLLPDNTATRLIESEDKCIVVGTMSGIVLIKPDGGLRRFPGLDDVYINDFVEDEEGMLWLATERGLYRINRKTGYFELFNEANGLPGNQVSGIIIDHEGSKWLSTKKAGLIRMNLGSILSLGKTDGITSTRINAIRENNGNVYIGSDDGSIYVMGESGLKEVNLSTKRRQVGVRDFLFNDGELWVASYLGVSIYKNGREELITTEDGLSANTVRVLHRSKDGRTWLASRTGGAMVLRGRQLEKVYDTSNGLNSNFVLALAETNEGEMVIGTHSGGISFIGDSIRSYMPPTGGLVIFNIYVDHEARLWITSSGGVYVFQDGQFQQAQFEAEFNVETVFDFVPDNAGNVWMSTINGILRCSWSELDEFAKGRRENVVASIFDHNDGMSIRECTGATRSTLLSTGEVWVPTIDGIAMVNPDRIRFNDQVPQIAITSFVVDDVQLPMDVGSIEPGKLRYEFEFASTSYLASDRIQFKYQLSGLDEEWISTSANRIEYTNLAPGPYTFSVIGSNNDGIWNEEGDKLTFFVRPFYYQTALFKIIMGTLVILIFYFIFVWRVRRVKAINSELSKVNEELDRFVYSASHDIRAPITSILGAATIAKMQKTAEEKNASLEMIETSAKRLDGFIRDIIDYSRNQRLEIVSEDMDVKKEIDEILESLKYLDEPGKVRCEVECDVSSFVTDARRLRVILKNIIANAFLYSDHSEDDPYVLIECRKNYTDLVIIISDNGLGMKQEILDHIFTMFYRGTTGSKGSGLGLYIAKENIDKLGGSIQVASKLKRGTTFTIVVPELEEEPAKS